MSGGAKHALAEASRDPRSHTPHLPLQVLAEKQHALAEAEAQSERARRERLEAAAVRQRAEQEARIDRQREQMQKQIMKLLHRQVQRYWMLAKARRAAPMAVSYTHLTLPTKA